MKKTYTPAFKAQVVQELLKETKTITQLAAEHRVHPHLLRDEKVTVRKGMASLFEQGDSVEALRSADDQQREDRDAQIGRLTTQVIWLKKNLAATLTRAERMQLRDRPAPQRTMRAGGVADVKPPQRVVPAGTADRRGGGYHARDPYDLYRSAVVWVASGRRHAGT